jgi:hypothetical protein
MYQLVENIAKLFSKMILTNKKYLEPSKVLNAMVDGNGKAILYGE